MGDIHGRRDLLDRLLAQVEEDAARPPRPPRLVMVFLGDYVDRGPDSRAVVERLMAGPPSSGPLAGAEWICLKGNHEECMVRFLDDAGVARGWLWNGGRATVTSYVGTVPDDLEWDIPALQMLLGRALPPAQLRFLARLPLLHVEGDYAFAHAGIRPGVALADQNPDDLMWIRDSFLFDPSPLEKVVVHGHTIAPLPELRPNRIGIDTGAYASGVLTAVVLEGSERRFLST
ncbi:metallophosphoesterase family protein [Magnetospirillum sp. UT-4]|uniref:metallophosphoesterase family protein n=1 Tax=Magnetospirillum sp. UT-4 TaxID=2681467 RepID=UPI0020C44BDD|nr:metallophosphoesterase family protein [Magnetospirillum sp. UT-4]